jgi:hypothetical protein
MPNSIEKIMKVLNLFTIISLMSIGQSFSQPDSSSENHLDEAPKIIAPNGNVSWEVGLNMLTLIDKEKGNFNALIRRNYGNKALRIRPLFGMQYSPNPTGISNFNSKRIEYGLYVGHEWKKNVSSKFEIFYGIELGYSKINQKNSVLDDPNGSVYYSVVETYLDRAMGNIIIGPKIFLTRYISISMETTLAGVMSKSKINTKRYQTSINTNDILISTQKTKYSAWYKDFSLIPIYAINISYYF